MGKQSRCQCTPSCKKQPLPNSPFCEDHIKFCPRKAPLSGYEPEFNPDKYNKYSKIKDTHNCFAYAFDYMDTKSLKKCGKDKCALPFPQPGLASGYPGWGKVRRKICPDLVSRLLGDVKDLKSSTFENKCPGKSSKIALVADEDEDYHFYRQDSNGMWSHKPGATDVTHIDSTGRPIYDPLLASRAYDSGLDYDRFCGYLCAPKGKKLHFKRGGKRYTVSKRRTISKRRIARRHNKTIKGRKYK
jgi:hypothetical protein